MTKFEDFKVLCETSENCPAESLTTHPLIVYDSFSEAYSANLGKGAWCEVYRFNRAKRAFDLAVRYVQQQVYDNQELFLAQIIKVHPEIDLLKYSVCYQPLPNFSGNKFWLEKL